MSTVPLLENMKRDTAVLFIQGYREEKILLFFMTDVMADILISIPLANLFMGIIIIKICENSMYQTIFAQEERKLLFIAGYLVIPIIMSACAFLNLVLFLLLLCMAAGCDKKNVSTGLGSNDQTGDIK